MPQEREGQPGKIQSSGREENAAQPTDAAKDKGGPERYPPVRQDDAIERTTPGEWVRTFESTDEAAPRRDTADHDGGQKDFEGPQADPAEGKP